MIHVNPRYVLETGGKRLRRCLKQFNQEISLSKAQDLVARILGYKHVHAIPPYPKALKDEIPYSELLGERWEPFVRRGIQCVRQAFPNLRESEARTVVYSGLPNPRLFIGHELPTNEELARRTYSYTIETPPEDEEEFLEFEMEVYTFGQTCIKCNSCGRVDPQPVQDPLDPMNGPPIWPDDDMCDQCEGHGILEKEDQLLTFLRASPTDRRRYLQVLKELDQLSEELDDEYWHGFFSNDGGTYSGYDDEDEDNPDDPLIWGKDPDT